MARFYFEKQWICTFFPRLHRQSPTFCLDGLRQSPLPASKDREFTFFYKLGNLANLAPVLVVIKLCYVCEGHVWIRCVSCIEGLTHSGFIFWSYVGTNPFVVQHWYWLYNSPTTKRAAAILTPIETRDPNLITAPMLDCAIALKEGNVMPT